MKKFLSIILFFIICCSTLVFTGCNNNKDEQFHEIQSITYMLGDDSVTVNSMVYLDYTSSATSGIYYTEEDYQNAENKGTNNYYTYGIIEVDKTVKNQGPYIFNDGLKPEDLKVFVGKTYMCPYQYEYYTQIEYKALHISYLKIKFIDETTFELKYYSTSQKDFITQKISSDNYVISYFLD